MTQRKQKKLDARQKTLLIEGVSKKIAKQFEKVIEEFEENNKLKTDQKKAEYDSLCGSIEDLAFIANDCYRLFIGDQIGLNVNSRNPFILLKYTQLFLTSLLEIKKFEIEEKNQKTKENQNIIASYNQNNIYQLVAKKNIEFLQLQNSIKELKTQLDLSLKRTTVAEQMIQSIKQTSDNMLSVYRQNFYKMSDFLKQAEQKQTELLQSNRLLNQEMQTITLEYEIYRKNFKKKTDSEDKEKRLRERIQKQFDEKLKTISKQFQYRLKQSQKNKSK